ncbi:MAG: gliding motility protein GldN, partial [Bacteroidota bacterium]|nr:gliding motility protein GldN [Bacteroidota bacterium]
KGIWFFDKKASELKYRLLGIQPVVANTEELKDGVANPKLDKPTFWIWYPSIREELNKHLVFNERNNENRITFDALLINRRFNSYIYKYDNMYGDRSIKDYIVQRPGESDESFRIRFILESERIKKEILDFENDMWGY